MKEFWEGFHKRAEDVMEDWQEQSKEENEKAKQKKEPMPSLATMLHGMPPDQYWRSWP